MPSTYRPIITSFQPENQSSGRTCRKTVGKISGKDVDAADVPENISRKLYGFLAEYAP